MTEPTTTPNSPLNPHRYLISVAPGTNLHHVLEAAEQTRHAANEIFLEALEALHEARETSMRTSARYDEAAKYREEAEARADAVYEEAEAYHHHIRITSWALIALLLALSLYNIGETFIWR